MPPVVKFTFFILTMMMLSFSIYASQKSTDGISDLFLLINQRLSYMEDIAAYKAEKNLAIEDLQQEEKILKNAMLLAEQKGIRPDSIKPFFSALMNVAKSIQFRYQADWKEKSVTKKPSQNLTQIRYKLIQLNTDLIEKLHQMLISGQKFDQASSKDMIKMIHQPQLNEMDKKKIVMTLQAVRLN